MTKFCQLSEPVMGKSRHTTPSQRIKVSANQKVGMAWPTTASVRAKRSARLLGRTAASTPSGMASTSAKAIAQAPRIMVTGSRAKITSATGWRSVYERPKSPAQGTGEPVEILDDDGPVEAVELADRLDVRRPRAFAGDGDSRIARDVDHREGDERDGQRHQQRDTQPLQGKG